MNHLFRQSLILPFILFTVLPAFTCTCIPIEDFCSSIYDSNYIILGEIGESIDELKISVDVLEQIHRNIPYDKIEIFGGGGFEATCIAGPEEFSQGDTVVLSLSFGRDWLVGSPVEDQMTDSTFVRSLCGIHLLQYSEGDILGPIVPLVQSMDYNAFVAEIELCIDFPSGTGGPKIGEPEFFISPNPAISSFSIEVLDVAIENVEIYTVAGKQVRAVQSNDQRLTIIQTDQLAAGVYLVKVTFADRRVGVRKLVVAR